MSILFLSFSILAALLIIRVNASTTHHVYPGQSIQEAINSAQTGDTIFVHNGTYIETVVVNKTISLIGENKYNTIIDGGGTLTSVMDITISNVTVSGFTVKNTSNTAQGFGIQLEWSNNCSVYDNYITNTAAGINLKYSSNNRLLRNIAANNFQYGIRLVDSSHDNLVSSNNITDTGVYAIGMSMSLNNLVYHNNIINNTYQANTTVGSINTWDNGYPSGGNYWSDQYHGDCADHYGGPSQNIPGSDGIVDDAYVINANNTDRYPLMNPWPCEITPPAPVGGIYLPVNKLELLAPYIGLAILLAVAVMIVVYVKKRKRDTEIFS